MWIFPPRKIQSKLLTILQKAPKRPLILYLLMHHAELPVEYNILQRLSIKQKAFYGSDLFLKPVKSKTSFKSYTGPSATVFLLPSV